MESFVKLNLLIRYADKKNVPQDTYIILDMNGGKFYVHRNRYRDFQSAYLSMAKIMPSSHLVMDLNWAVCHNIVLDVDFKNERPTEKWHTHRLQLWMHKYVNEVAIPALQSALTCVTSFTVICARRPESAGIHFYLPEIAICNDDYHMLLKHLESRFKATDGNVSFALDLQLKNFNLAYTSKPDCENGVYQPFLVFCIKQGQEDVYHLNFEDAETYKITNARIKKSWMSKNVMFKTLLSKSYNNAKELAIQFMMPVVDNNLVKRIKVCYETRIIDTAVSSYTTGTRIGSVGGEMRISKIPYLNHIFKSDELTLTNTSFAFMHSYLAANIQEITELETGCEPIKRWLQDMRLKVNDEGNYIAGDNNFFANINEKLVRANRTLGELDEVPLKKVLEFADGIYFVPMFYALCKIRNLIKYNDLVNQLNNLLTNATCLKLLQKFGEISETVVDSASQHFTEATIEYCACNMFEKNLNFKDMCSFIMELFKHKIVQCFDTETATDLVLKLFDIYSPFESSYEFKYIWSCVQSQWYRMTKIDDIKATLTCLVFSMKNTWDKYQKQSNPQVKKPKFSLHETGNSLYHIAYSQCNSKDSTIMLDDHKWSLGLPNGLCLCLLTGHVFKPVPQLYHTSRCVKALSVERFDFQRLIDDTNLQSLFRLLWNREFLNEYVAYMDETESDNYVESLKCFLVEEKGITSVIYLSDCEQMLNFYLHLCKFLCFDYDEMWYLMHAITSNLVATNYGKFLYFVHGKKNNGKTKLFSLFKSVLGSYTATIDSNSLCDDSIKRDTKPDIARNIFNSRIMLAEELGGKVNQNFLKILTGNSEISIRALYENCRQGIPTAKLWISTNDPPNCTTTDAFSERVIPFHFRSTFSMKKVPSTSREQIEKRIFTGLQDDEVINGSKLGMLLHMLYLHFDKFDKTTGFLEQPPVPQSILEFKEEYLHCTDLYNQFKTFADVQSLPNETTTQSELDTAIRKFIIVWKLKNIRESDIANRFKKEFASKELECLYNDDDDDDDDDGDDDYDDNGGDEELARDRDFFDVFCGNSRRRAHDEPGPSSSIDRDEFLPICSDSTSEPKSKRIKMSTKTTVYQNVSIKNFRTKF